MKIEKLYIVEDFAEELNVYSLSDTNGFSGYIDYSEYTYVDGEEGDHGKIKYYDSNMNLMAIKNEYGGDSYEWYWTDGFKLFALEVLFVNMRNKADAL